MKKLLLIIFILFSAEVFAQKTLSSTSSNWVNSSSSKIHQAIPRIVPAEVNSYIPYNNSYSRKLVSPTSSSSSSRSLNATESLIGTTDYDLQTDGSINNRLVYNADSTVSAVWTFSPDVNTGYPNRGTGYNFFNKTSWGAIPTTRIESGEGNDRSGFPDIGVTSTGRELVIAHAIQNSGSSLGMLLTSRPSKGTGSWNVNDTILGKEPADTIDLWAKMTVGGADGQSIHAIWRGGAAARKIFGQAGPLLYSRSTDNGATWPVLESVLTPIDSDFYNGFSADNYAIDARGDVIAIVAGGEGTDVVLLKSIDNGDTWIKTVIVNFPIPKYDPATMITDTNNDGVADTLLSCSGDPEVVIDSGGTAHVFFSVVNVNETASESNLFYFPYTDGLFYWNENMSTGAVEIARAPRLNGDSNVTIPHPISSGFCTPTDDWGFGIYGGAITERPSAGVDANNNIYLCYQSIDENSDTTSYGKDFKHVYLIKSTDGGTTWTNPDNAFDVVAATQPTQNADLEGVYACMAKHIDNKIRLIYERDGAPGTLVVQDSCDEANNNATSSLSNIIYVEIDTSFTVGIPQLPGKIHGLIVSPNFPNPATSSTQFNITLNAPLNVQVEVTDMLGQNVYTENKGMLPYGIHLVTLNTSYLSAGVYFYTVIAGEERVTGKMIVK